MTARLPGAGGVRLTVLTADDLPLWERARLAALTDAPHAFTVGLADWHAGGRERWRARLAIAGSLNVVALRGEEPVGMVRGVPRDGRRSELRSPWVGTGARGDGLGSLLIETVAAWAARSGAAALDLAVLTDNAPALALYRRHGFVPAGARGGAGGAPGERMLTRALRA
ncbi:GNAT family N-acetyltransferase [Streptomyces marincola]|uniref:GNAT family N-acetyltransferase n=1 Tax=Streptomyces marincola TaxID=2878388 RepID=UPI001CF36563|nr:GNAT family N-acetyltransferase [Streptomyces marincola]UCM90470.1 GNAT family N-acetyltransferase [Streptomyces marincola]